MKFGWHLYAMILLVLGLSGSVQAADTMPTLQYNTVVGIKSVGLNKHLWGYSSWASGNPNTESYEALLGPNRGGKDTRDLRVPFFAFQAADDVTRMGPLRYGDAVRIVMVSSTIWEENADKVNNPSRYLAVSDFKVMSRSGNGSVFYELPVVTEETLKAKYPANSSVFYLEGPAGATGEIHDFGHVMLRSKYKPNLYVWADPKSTHYPNDHGGLYLAEQVNQNLDGQISPDNNKEFELSSFSTAAAINRLNTKGQQNLRNILLGGAFAVSLPTRHVQHNVVQNNAVTFLPAWEIDPVRGGKMMFRAHGLKDIQIVLAPSRERIESANGSVGKRDFYWFIIGGWDNNRSVIVRSEAGKSVDIGKGLLSVERSANQDVMVTDGMPTGSGQAFEEYWVSYEKGVLSWGKGTRTLMTVTDSLPLRDIRYVGIAGAGWGNKAVEYDDIQVINFGAPVDVVSPALPKGTTALTATGEKVTATKKERRARVEQRRKDKKTRAQERKQERKEEKKEVTEQRKAQRKALVAERKQLQQRVNALKKDLKAAKQADKQVIKDQLKQARTNLKAVKKQLRTLSGDKKKKGKKTKKKKAGKKKKSKKGKKKKKTSKKKQAKKKRAGKKKKKKAKKEADEQDNEE